MNNANDLGKGDISTNRDPLDAWRDAFRYHLENGTGRRGTKWETRDHDEWQRDEFINAVSEPLSKYRGQNIMMSTATFDRYRSGKSVPRGRQLRAILDVFWPKPDLRDAGSQRQRFRETAARARTEHKSRLSRKKQAAFSNEDPLLRKMSAISNILIGPRKLFLGRDDALKLIKTALAHDKGRVAITALHGLRGVGKTTLAMAYADRNRGRYRIIWWIRAETEHTMRADLVALGERLNWIKEHDKLEPFAIVMEHLNRQRERILLIYDNAIDARAIHGYLPRARAVHAIVTSNSYRWREVAEPIEIEVWQENVGAAFLIARTGRTDEGTAAAALSRLLGGLPLAHEQAAAYCEDLGIGFADYERRLEEATDAVLDDKEHAPADYQRDHPDGFTVAGTFHLAIERASKRHPAAASLIILAALLAPEPIPIFLFAEAREKFGEPLTSALAGDGLQRVIAALRDLALVELKEIAIEGAPGGTKMAAIQLHRVVREVALNRSEQTIGEGTLTALAQSIENGMRHPRFAGARAQVMPHAVSLLYFLQTNKYKDSSAGELYATLAKRVIITLFDLGPSNIIPEHLASVLRDYYEDGPLFRAISEFRQRDPEAWARIEPVLVKENNFVLRHAMSHVLAGACGPNKSLLADTRARFDRAGVQLKELHEFEFTGYALALIYAREPKLIDHSFVEKLAQYPIYPGQQLAGDLLLNLVFQATKPELVSWERWLEIRAMGTDDRLWKSDWDFIKLHSFEIAAAEAFITNRTLPQPCSNVVKDCHANLLDINRELLDAKGTVRNKALHDLLEQYYALGREPAAVQRVKEELRSSPNRRNLFRLLLGHPIWYVAEETAAILSSLAEEDSECLKMIYDFLGDKNWRVRYGANEAAFSARGHYPEVFERSVRDSFKDLNCRIRALCTENFVSVLLISTARARERLIGDFGPQIRRWLDDEDCAIFEHVYRLFAGLHRKGIDLTADPFKGILSGSASRLVSDEPSWYMLDRSEFLQHIEDRKKKIGP